MKFYEKDTPLCNLNFDKTTFRVQVHVIPIRYMNKAVAEKICELLGEIIQTTKKLFEQGGNFIRFKVALDVSLPLCRGLLISLEGGKQVWVTFKYKCLLNICYYCGCLDHDDKDYDI